MHRIDSQPTTMQILPQASSSVSQDEEASLTFRQKSWNLKDVLPAHSGPEFEAKVKSLQNDAERFERRKERLTATIPATELRETLSRYESLVADDARFKWKPTIIVELDENWEKGHVKGFIAITNESAKRFDDVDVSFADFAKDMSEDAMNIRLQPAEFKMAAKKQRMKMMKIK